MTNYELLFILPGTLAEAEVKPLIAKVKSVFEENGATDLTVEELDKKRLAYPIKHIRYGYFQLAYFQAEAEAIKTIKNKLKMMSELLRVLVKKIDPKSKVERKINFGVAIGEEMKRPSRADSARPVAVREPFKKETTEPEEKVEIQSLSREEAEGITVVKPAEVVDKKVKEDKPKKKVKLDEIDKKLDEILDIDLTNV